MRRETTTTSGDPRSLSLAQHRRWVLPVVVISGMADERSKSQFGLTKSRFTRLNKNDTINNQWKDEENDM